MDTSVPARLPRDYLCRTKLNNYADGWAAFYASAGGFLGKALATSPHAIAIRRATCALTRPIVGSPGVALKFRSAASAPAEYARGMHTRVYSLSDEQSIPANEPCRLFTVRALRNNRGKVGRTVSTFRKAVREHVYFSR